MPDNSGNTSATGGYLTPIADNVPVPPPQEGKTFEDTLQDLVVNLTELDGTLVRPAWQPEPPNQPDNATDWVAFSILNKKADTFAYVAHDGGAGDDSLGLDRVQRNELVEVLFTHYGPNAHLYADLVRDGLSVEQNREGIKQAATDLVEVREQVVAPELINNLYYYRVDQTIVFRRQVDRFFGVKNVGSFEGGVVADGEAGDIKRDISALQGVEPPPP